MTAATTSYPDHADAKLAVGRLAMGDRGKAQDRGGHRGRLDEFAAGELRGCRLIVHGVTLSANSLIQGARKFQGAIGPWEGMIIGDGSYYSFFVETNPITKRRQNN